jgi:hypothetical protein
VEICQNGQKATTTSLISLRSQKSSPCPHRSSSVQAQKGIRGAFAKNTIAGLMISGAPKEQPETNDQEKIKAETSSRSVPIKFKKASSESQRFISV